MRALVVEDELRLAAGVRNGLEAEGYAVDVALTGTDGLWLAREQTYDVMLLDIMLPQVDGFEICATLRSEGVWTPILMLTARSSELDEVLGLDAGADDYLTKPFSLSVLSARVRALLRRRGGGGDGEREVAGVKVDPVARRAWRDGRELELSPKEFDLLALLVARAGEAVPRDEIMTTVWDANWFGPTKTLDTHVGWLRRKLGEPPVLTTVRGVGFRFEGG